MSLERPSRVARVPSFLGRVAVIRRLGYRELKPDGGSLAYTSLPPSIRRPSADSPAEVWLLNLSTGQARVLAANADLLVAPVWAPDGRSLVFRRSYPVENAAGAFELVRVGVEGGETVCVFEAAK